MATLRSHMDCDPYNCWLGEPDCPNRPKGEMVSDDRTQYHIDKAEYLLEMAGEPKTADQIFQAAASNAMLALVGQIRQGMPIQSYEPLADWEKELLNGRNLIGPVANGGDVYLIDPLTANAWDKVAGYPVGTTLGNLATHGKAVIAAMRNLEAAVPGGWETRKIHAIKEIRNDTLCGLKEAKEFVEAVVARRLRGDADFW